MHVFWYAWLVPLESSTFFFSFSILCKGDQDFFFDFGLVFDVYESLYPSSFAIFVKSVSKKSVKVFEEDEDDEDDEEEELNREEKEEDCNLDNCFLIIFWSWIMSFNIPHNEDNEYDSTFVFDNEDGDDDEDDDVPFTVWGIMLNLLAKSSYIQSQTNIFIFNWLYVLSMWNLLFV